MLIQDVVIVDDYCVCWFLGSRVDCSFFTACLQAITLTALQTAGVFLSLCSRLFTQLAFCTTQAALQTAAIIAAVLVVNSP